MAGRVARRETRGRVATAKRVENMVNVGGKSVGAKSESHHHHHNNGTTNLGIKQRGTDAGPASIR